MSHTIDEYAEVLQWGLERLEEVAEAEARIDGPKSTKRWEPLEEFRGAVGFLRFAMGYGRQATTDSSSEGATP